MDNEKLNTQQLANISNHRQIIRNHEHQVENFKRLKRISFDFDSNSVDNKKIDRDGHHSKNRISSISNNYTLQRHNANTVENDCTINMKKLQYISWYIQLIVFPGLLLFIILYESNISVLTKLYAMVIYVIFVMLLFINSPHVYHDDSSNDKNYEFVKDDDGGGSSALRKLNVIPEELDLHDSTREPLIENDGKLGTTNKSKNFIYNGPIVNSKKYLEVMKSMGKLLTNIVI